MQDLIRRYDGVVSTRVGYTGGEVPNATYRDPGIHAEAIEITFDPSRSIATECSGHNDFAAHRRPHCGDLRSCMACIDPDQHDALLWQRH